MGKIPNWRDKNYLAYQLQHYWVHLVPGIIKNDFQKA